MSVDVNDHQASTPSGGPDKKKTSKPEWINIHNGFEALKGVLFILKVLHDYGVL